ncbi:MAG TPA: aspartate/glutamate racemase family protein, partial [Spirochaetia bacterium]|nr:aspartate/glutamate racemase family protein [Spirochaetia bacterium]
MAERPVVFYDSGIGGLPYLAWVRERRPDAHFIYVGDNEHFPYGEKTHEELRRIAVSVVGRILTRFDPQLVVVACNTASVVALAELRARYPVAFVGVVPAVKPAAERSRGRRIALLATTRTVGDAYSEKLIKEYASDCTVVRIAG